MAESVDGSIHAYAPNLQWCARSMVDLIENPKDEPMNKLRQKAGSGREDRLELYMTALIVQCHNSKNKLKYSTHTAI